MDRRDQKPGLGLLLLYAACAAALILGLYSRFKGLAGASMVADEYYIARSVENVLKHGLPQYDCGGYYPRALIFQYVVALLAAAGMSIETAARALAAVSSVIALPAVYWLGRRAGGRAVAVAALAIVAVSVWEVEVARFGRMYAPFQAVFVWYLVYFVKLTVDRTREALWPLLALTVLGVLMWEGGAFLALASLVAPFVNNPKGRLTWRDIVFLAINVVLFVAMFALMLANLRLAGSTEPQFPADFDVDAAREATRALISVVGSTRSPWSTLSLHPAWIGIGLLPLLLVLNALRSIWTYRDRWPVAVGLLLVLVLAVYQQFAAALAMAIVLPLLGLVKPEEFTSLAAKRILAAVAACFVFWLAFGLLTADWREGVTSTWIGGNHLAWLGYEFIRMPNVLLQVVRPWSHSVPVLGLGLAALLLIALARSLRWAGESSAERALMLITVCLLVLVGLTEPPRQETRYVFFLYPVAVILVLGASVHIAEFIGARWQGRADVIGVIVLLGLFMLTEDFQPKHLATIDSAAANVRLDIPPKLETHIVPRTDVRGATDFLAAHVAPGHTLLINAFPGADYYFSQFDFTYIGQDNERFGAYACRRGTVERWGNLPLVHAMPQLDARIAASGRALMVVSQRESAYFMESLARWHPRVVWTASDGELVILEFGSPAT